MGTGARDSHGLGKSLTVHSDTLAALSALTYKDLHLTARLLVCVMHLALYDKHVIAIFSHHNQIEK